MLRSAAPSWLWNTFTSMFTRVTIVLWQWCSWKLGLCLMRSLVPGWTHLRVHQSKVVESWDRKGTLPTSNFRKG
jgi:hypothetical protein